MLTRLSESEDIPSLDAATDGLLIHSDNFQALNLLQARYREQVKCIYIDPPYNTDASAIIYKNGYRHSSWCSLMNSRISKSINLLNNAGTISIAIDSLEFSNLELLTKEILGTNNYISTIAIQHNPKGREKEHFADSHEYLLFAAKNKNKAKTYRLNLNNEELAKKYSKGTQNSLYRELPLRRSGSEAQREDRPYMFFPFLCKKDNLSIKLITDNEYEKIYTNGRFNDHFIQELKKHYEAQGFYFVLPIRDDGSNGRWRWGFETCKEGIAKKTLFAKLNKKTATIYAKDEADSTYLPKSFWYGERFDASSKGTNILKSILPNNTFDYPKSIFVLEDIIRITSSKIDTILDYFAGSGTTAHAVINLNREDGGKRKYILVEQAEYFNTVLKPRVQKVIYSKEWKDGKPQADGDGNFHGVPQIVKVLKLESYEDTLNNLQLKKPDLLAHTLNEQTAQDYLLHYMLDMESRDSLLSTDDFRKPFDYRLNIATDSAGAYTPQVIDLVETFNYLLGLRVDSVEDRRHDEGYVFVEGYLNGELVLLLWRDCEHWDYDGLQRLLAKKKIKPQDSEFAEIYINGDHTLPTVWQDNDAEGGMARTLKIRSIEAEFLRLMFAEAE